ncbi:hypothetical protein QIH87_49800 (plasmid) [Bradyrhizobium elkanii]|uniref:hypothetical protein n=1 Tax=Bradyrhizobium elkanii TaxID=29448 RepID=UPI002714AC90|nr:hypothetical protein [Bradyrhizobium elkanii]WLB14824.1 hypothetical protein QIH87_49800 [Bradyrhizobium elkanii]WLB69084.1 hypothetical protein QIH89_27605 [Bradyrhizobium elkanii]
MLSPGYKSLGTFSITVAGTAVGDWVTGLEGCLSILAQMRLVYGSGGTTVRAYLQTSADNGDTPIDVACVLFGTASENAVLNLSALTPKTTQVTPSDGAMTDDTNVDGIIGDRFRVKVVSTGTYAGSTQLVCSAVVR